MVLRNSFTKLSGKAGGLLLVVMALFILSDAGSIKTFAQSTTPQTVPQLTTFGSWTKVCVTPPGTPSSRCELVQSTRGKDRPDIALRVSFSKQPQRKDALLVVTVPIRVELQLGIGITIDGKDMGNMMYRRCAGENCFAEVLVNEKVMQAFFEGKSATFYIFTTPEEGIGSVVDLSGLKAGYDTLQ